MHKKMLALSALARRRGDPPAGAPRHRPGAVQRRLLARRLRRPLPAAPARRDLAEPRGGGGRRCGGARGSPGTCWTSTATATRRSGSTRAAFSAHREPRAGRRGRGVHALRERRQLRQHAHPPARGLPRSCPGASRRPRRPRATRARPAFTTSRRASGSTCARRSTPTTARCSWTGSCRGAPALEDYAAAAVLGHAVVGPERGAPYTVERRKGGVEITCTAAGERTRLEKRIRCDAEGNLDGRVAVGPVGGGAGRPVRDRAVACRTRRPGAPRQQPTSGGSRSRRSPSRSGGSIVPARANR